MNFEKAQQLTESIHRTVEALNECCRTTNQTQSTQGNTASNGQTSFGGHGFYPMGFGWSPYHVGANPTNSTNCCAPGGATSWSGWNGSSYSNPYSYANAYGYSNPYSFANAYGYTNPSSFCGPNGGSFGFPTSGFQGSTPWNGYAPVQTFGGTPSTASWNHPVFGFNPFTGFMPGSNGFSNPTSFSGWGVPATCGPSYFQGSFPTGMWGPSSTGSFPFQGMQGFGFPFYGTGPTGCVDGTCGPQGQQTGWTPNVGPTGACDVPLAA